MSLDATSLTPRLCVSAAALIGVSCTSAAAPVAAPGERGTGTTLSAAPSSRADAAATRDELVLSGGHFEVTASRLAVRHGATGSTVQGDVQARALRSIRELRFDYCGPAPMFLSVDGSTVEPTVDGGVLRAPLHWPLEPEERFSFRFVTTMSDHAGSDPPATEDIADALLCR
ncbi:MAG: hypothetical protein KY457_02350 [Actinobacteria bacterium]|nr:hypothetical protein [Actinomycetota bacterium]